MKKIIFIVDHLHGGGAERIALDLAKSLSKNYKVKIALLDKHNIRMDIPSKIEILNIDVPDIFCKGSLWRNRNNILKKVDIETIKNTINNEKADLIILTHYYAFQLLNHLDGNVWAWVHGQIADFNEYKATNIFRLYKEKRRLYLQKKYMNNIFYDKKIIFVNSDLENTYNNKLFLNKSRTIYNGIDFSRLDTNINTNKKYWDIIFVGRLSREKRPDYAIKAFLNSKSTGRMALVGDGPLLEDLKKLTRDLNGENRIDFLGWQKDVSQFIKKSKYLLLTSKMEGCPLVIAESIILGTPVIAFNCCSGVEYLLNSKNLRNGLVPSGDIKALTDKIDSSLINIYSPSKEEIDRLNIKHMTKQFEALII